MKENSLLLFKIFLSGAAIIFSLPVRPKPSYATAQKVRWEH